jgi:Leucine-rich repeat (LRR) protein
MKKIKEISRVNFYNLTRLTTLNLKYNDIESIDDPLTFADCLSLEVIVLAGNKIKSIAPDTFIILKSLEQTHLNFNECASCDL